MSCARMVWWTVLYAVAIVVGRATALPETGLALFWPAAGIAALWVKRSTPAVLVPSLAAIFAVTLGVHVAVGVPWAPASLLAGANVVVGCAVRQVLGWALPSLRGTTDRSRRAEVMGSIRGVIALAQAAVAAGVASAPLGVLAGYLLTDHVSLVVTAAWVVRNTTGVFVVAGVVLAVVAARHAHRPGASWSSTVTSEGRPRGGTELAVTVVVAGTAFHVVFDNTHGLPLPFLLVAVAAYVGFRFAPVVAALLTTAGALVAIHASLAGTGPFADIGDPLVGSLVVQTFVLVQAAISLMLSWAVRERQDMLVQLLAARQQADERAQLLDAVTDRLDHGVAVIDGEGRLVVQNPAAARLVPGPTGRVGEGDDLATYGVRRVDGAPLDLASMPHTVALTTGESVSTELAVRREGAEESFVSVRVDPLDLDGDPARRVAVLSFRDDTAHHRQVEELETFAGAVAHDLRSPLTAMTSWVEVLTDHLVDRGTLDADAREALARISSSGERMSQLIGDLLAYATAASAPLDVHDIDLDEAVSQVADELVAASDRGPVIDARGLGTLVGDPSLVRQLLANVIGNAVKYTADDVRPVVRLRAEHGDRGVVLRVTDNGVGVPEHLQSAIFDRFTRVASTATSRPGSGLGLALCARAVERHDGTIELTSAPGGFGSTVTMTFPTRPRPVPAPV